MSAAALCGTGVSFLGRFSLTCHPGGNYLFQRNMRFNAGQIL